MKGPLHRIRRLGGLGLDLSPLRTSRSFRLLFCGRLVSLLGLGMLVVALPVQVYQLTGSSLHVAGVNTCLGIAAFAGTLVAGVVADRTDRRRVILWSRSAALLGFVGLLGNSLLDEPSVVVLYVLAVWDGLAGGFSVVALAAAVPTLVDRTQLPAVGALQAVTLDLGAVVAPLLAGITVANGGTPVVYGVVVGASLVSLGFLWRLPPLPPGSDEDHAHGAMDDAAADTHPWHDLVDGLRYVTGDRLVGGIVLVGFVQILFASPHVLIPELVDTRLHAGPEVVGLLYGAPAVGALVATLTSGWTGRVHRTGRALLVVLMLSAAGVAVLGLSGSVLLAVVAMALVGAGDVIGEILRFTMLYERAPDRLRGRVSSLWTAQGTAGDALGGPLLTVLAKGIGAGGAIAVGGVLAIVATAWVALALPELRTATASGDDDDPDGPASTPGDAVTTRAATTPDLLRDLAPTAPAHS